MWRRNRRMPEPADGHRKLVLEPEPRPTIPLPADTLADRDAETAAEVRKQHWLDEAYEAFEQSGGAKTLPGYGKPLVIPTGDVMSTILRNANVTHPWVTLRQTIFESMLETARLIDRNPHDPRIDEQLADINRRIVQMNVEAPSLILHRRKVCRETLREQLDRWH